MESMAINLHRRLLNSSDGGVYDYDDMSKGGNMYVVIAIAAVPVLSVILLFLLFKLFEFLSSRDLEAVLAAAAAEAAAFDAAEAGLRKHELRRLPKAVYRLDRDEDCTICLGKFVDGEKIRILPCGHRFHVGCVDKWLVSQASCPNCRISLLQHVINL